MSRQSGDSSHGDRALAPIVKELEAALLEYVERYGPTDRARSILIEISMLSHHFDPLPDEKL